MSVAQILTPDLLKIISTNLSEPKNVKTESFSKFLLKTLYFIFFDMGIETLFEDLSSSSTY